MRKNFKKLMAISLTVAMTMASTMVAYAEDNMTGDGSFEGPDLENPPIAVSLPTSANIDYIADPNNLIVGTADASGEALKDEYKGVDFSGDSGIYFPTVVSGDVSSTHVLKYTNESQDLKAYNKSRQAIKFTVKMEAVSGDASIAYASGDVFDNSGDTARKVYFGVTDGASGDAAITATGATGAATFQTEVAGTEDNFKVQVSGDAYEYVQTDEAIASGDAAWQCATYKLKGAANKHGDWGKDKNLAFPQIKVTWTYADAAAPADADPSIADITYSKASNADLVIPYSLGAGESGADALTDVMLQFDSSTFHSKNGTWGTPTTYAKDFTIGTNSITIAKGYLTYVSNGDHKLVAIFDGDDSAPYEIKVTVQD